MTLPASRAERDEWFELPGTARFCTSGDNYFIRGIPIACDFRILPLLNQLLTEACLAGHTLTYQIHIRSIRIDPEYVRQARRFVVALGDLPGARSAILESQRKLAWRLEQATAICEEYICVGSTEAANWLKLWIYERFRANHGSLGFDSDLCLRTGAFEDSLTAAIHSYDFEPWSPMDLAGAAQTADDRDALLNWQPDERLDRVLSPGDSVTDPLVPSFVPLIPPPQTYNGESRFVFASYKRQDLLTVGNVLKQVRSFGVPVWYDVQIPGGSEWDEVIEERLSNSKALLAFLSAAAIESRYVRREIKFADALGRPVLAILMEDVQLRHGLRMMMAQYQTLDLRAADFHPRLRYAVTRLFDA
jgi:TIR domain